MATRPVRIHPTELMEPFIEHRSRYIIGQIHGHPDAPDTRRRYYLVLRLEGQVRTGSFYAESDFLTKTNARKLCQQKRRQRDAAREIAHEANAGVLAKLQKAFTEKGTRKSFSRPLTS